MRGETYHYSTSVMFKALCGAQTTVARNGHALTSRQYAVTCGECRRLWAGMSVRQKRRLTAERQGAEL